MSFKNITPDLTFKTPEVLNKYRNDKDIYEEINYSEK